MHVADTELDSRTIRCICKPEIQILSMLSCLEEEDVIAGVEVGKGIQSGIVVV
jgi:hypothetical protein